MRDYVGTIVVGIVLAISVGLAIYFTIKNKKYGKKGCGGCCDGCNGCSDKKNKI